MSLIQFFEHPEYARRATDWTTYQDLFNGYHDVLRSPKYLWLHELESEQGGLHKADAGHLRAIREQRSRNLNLTEPVVSRWTSILFGKGINVPDQVKNEVFGEDEYRDVTGTGVGFEAFVSEQVARNGIVFGKPIIYVDTTPIKADTKAQARAAGVRPFMEVISPLEAKDWQLSSDPGRIGKLDFFRTEYKAIKPRTSASDKPTFGTFSKVLSLNGGTYTISEYEAEGEGNSERWTLLKATPVTGWDELPISYLDGESFIKDVAEQQLALFNYMSAHSSMLNSQAFQRLFAFGNFSEENKLKVGEYLMSFGPEGASIQTIEPFSSDPLAAAINSTIDRLFKVAFNQLNGLAGDSKESPSAEARRELKEELITLARAYLTELEDVVNQAVGHYAKFKDKTAERIEFDKNITLDDIDRELMIINAHRDSIKALPTFHKAVLKKHATDLNLTNIDEVLKEIDAMKAPEPQGEDVRTQLLKAVNGERTGQPTTPT